MVLNEQQTILPQPRLPHEYGGSQDMELAFGRAAAQLRDEPAVIGNVSVHAVVADGEFRGLQDKIQVVKGMARGEKQPVGLTVPFDEFLPYIDMAAVENSRIQSLLEDPAELTSRSGALMFVRAPAKKFIGGVLVPECILSEDGTTVQDYSPVGNLRTNKFLNHAYLEGVKFPVMTSANKSKEPEIVTNNQARLFAKEAGLAFVPNLSAHDKQPKPKGSYPVVEITSRAIRIVRDGFFGKGIIKALFSGYPVEHPADAKPTNYPDGVLEIEDLPPYARNARGAELRAVILTYMGGRAVKS